MSGPCSDTFRELAGQLGGIDSATANPVVTLRAPWELENWTLPVVELLMVAGAALGLAHAVIMWRRHRQPGWLCLWMATVLYVLALEPFLYFPDRFGLDDRVGLVFAHNVFSIEFLYDRLPLYILALYPAGIYLAHLLVDRLGVFRSHGVVVGAIATGTVHHAFYEIFDHLGPQLRWWAWNPDAPGTGPLFASVPLSSMVIFATIGPTVVVGLARALLFNGADGRSGAAWACRTVATGVLTPLLVPIVSLPVSIVKAETNATLSITLFWVELVAFLAIGLWAILTSTPTGTHLSGLARHYPALHSSAYLAVFAVLWLTALSDLLDATGGRTADGTPIGVPFYAVACFGFCAWVVVRGLRPGTSAEPVDRQARRHHLADGGTGVVSPSPLLTARGLGLVAREAARVGLDRRRPLHGPVPLHASGITPRWIETTLSLPRGSVRSVTVLDEDSGTAARARIAIDADPETGLPATAFVKAMPRNYLQHVLMNTFDLGTREVLAYRALGGDPPVRIPRCYAAVTDDRRRRNIMILEDLGPTARFRTVTDSLTAAEAAAIVDTLAHLHTAFWQSERFTSDLAPLGGRSAVANALGDTIRRQLLGKLRGPAVDLVPSGMHRQSRIFYEASARIDSFWARQPQTLIHADPHLGNLFFIGDAPGLLDWQVTTINAGIRDVAYCLTASIAPDELRTAERGLVERYAARLGEAGIAVDPDHQWTLYRAGVTEFYLAAVSTAGSGERMQPIEVSRSGVLRAVAAVEAHDSFDVLAALATRAP